MRTCSLSVLPLASAIALFAACSSNKASPPVIPVVTVDAGDETGVFQGGSGDAGVDLDAGPPFFTGADAGAMEPVDFAAAAMDAPIDLAITAAAPKLAPKMEKEGQPGRATLEEGEHFSMMVTLAPNRCYTIIAHSPPGNVDKLEVKLFGPPLFNIEAGRSGANDKNMAVMGKGAAALCPIIPLAVPYKIDVGAAKGGGRIGVHVFARDK